MAETCIVCLGELTAIWQEQPRPSQVSPSVIVQPPRADITRVRKSAKIPLTITQNDPELIAHLLPCGHDFHNECLKPWVERANSCPICRQSFNEVELKANTCGPCITSYAVEERRQVADIDPSMIIDDEALEEAPEESCIICECNDEEELLGCDGCNGFYHVHCAGLDTIPAMSWYCQFCREDGTASTNEQPRIGRLRRRPRGRHTTMRRDTSPDPWVRVWQSVLSNLNLDLDFPFDEEEQEIITQRTRAQRRDFEEWQRRFRVAERQGGAARFRDTANTLLNNPQSRGRSRTPNPESQEELRAWNAFDKARELNSSAIDGVLRRNKRKSPTASPPNSSPQADRMLKRPRTRRAQDSGDRSQAEPSSSTQRDELNTAPPNVPRLDTLETDRRSFFSALLDEVATSPSTPDGIASRDPLTHIPIGQLDEPPTTASSTSVSPTLSAVSSPRSRSTSPSRYYFPRPASPPLASTITPLLQRRVAIHSPVHSSLVSNVANAQQADNALRDESCENCSIATRTKDRASSTKAEIESLVSTALKPAYQKKDINRHQFNNINREITRRLYEKLHTGVIFAEDSRKTWQSVAAEEVEMAVKRLKSSPEVDFVA